MNCILDQEYFQNGGNVFIKTLHKYTFLIDLINLYDLPLIYITILSYLYDHKARSD